MEYLECIDLCMAEGYPFALCYIYCKDFLGFLI